MATLIPSLSSCTRRMIAGERRFAQRLEDKLEDEYVCWYDVPVGPRQLHPDFIVVHPGRGLLILFDVRIVVSPAPRNRAVGRVSVAFA